MKTWLTREEALDALRVRPQTLYAYASRGRIGAAPDPADPRRSLYRGEDVAALTTRRARGRRAAAIAASAFAWGEPAVETGIATVSHGRLIYRGQDAVALAATATLEEAAALLWVSTEPVAFPSAPGGAEPLAALASLAATAPATLGRGAARMRADAAAAIGVLARALGARGQGPVHARLARHWGVEAAGAEAIRRALVLLADHELNASAFAVRVAASTGASVAAALLAGLAALTGPRHGGAGAALLALAGDAARQGPEAAVAAWLARDQPLPGFGHPLYPEGDARAEALLAVVPAEPGLQALAEAVMAATGARPNVDFALAALARGLGLPADAPFRLFALGRSTGWAAHAMEQAATGRLIRPRAHYAGPLPPG